MIMAACPQPDPEADGVELAAAYDRAMRDYASHRIPEGLTPEQVDRLRWTHHLLWLEMVDARDALRVHIIKHDPVETETGVYRLDGYLKLTFRLHPDPGAVPYSPR